MVSFIDIVILLTAYKKLSPDRKKSDMAKALLIGGLILSWIPGICDLMLVGMGIGALVYYSKHNEKKGKARDRAREYGWDAQKWDAAHQNTRTYEKYHEFRKQQTQEEKEPYQKKQTAESENVYYKAGPLTESLKKRRRIVENFNKKYDLFLTEEQVTSIVNSSYMSEVWKQEIVDMNRKYNIVQEWFTGPTAWLRVYMHAFHVQDITSDLQQQEDIAMYAFEAIFKYVDELGPMNQTDRIKAVNDRFFADFEDVGFMTAYKFLQEKGFAHKLEREKVTPYSTSSTVDDLLKKYETAEQRPQGGN